MKFTAQGREFIKSSKSQTDWTRNCLGVQVTEQTVAFGDSVTEDIIDGMQRSEYLSLLAAIK